MRRPEPAWQHARVDTAGTAVALTGYALAAPFVLWVPLFKRMWREPGHRLFAVHGLGVALVTAGWAVRREPVGAVLNGGYGVAVTAAYAWHRRHR